MDITQLILDDHHEQRRLFAILEEIDPGDRDRLESVWSRLSAFLELHAEAEERVFYPALLDLDRDAARAETEDAIHDHNDIRDAVAAVAEHPVGSDGWFQAIAKVNEANGDHMAEEEREGLADFRRHAPLLRRHELGVDFAAFEARHLSGVDSDDKDPERYIEDHSD
ncbi:MAG TPA: hemerythrin domain-containing protein [Solirubrobacteraceae bacterium]|jgi:hypothetical protein|nr:hemerythrin domain-containing protein [Solirubrobacteraceae bacterium]